MFDRRRFLQALGALTGGAVTSFLLPGCRWLTDTYKRDTMNALFDILIPSDPGSAGAVDARAIDFFRSDGLIRSAVNLGFLPDVAKSLARNTAGVLEHNVVVLLDSRAYLRDPKPFDPKGFQDMTRKVQEEIVADLFGEPIHRQLLDVCRLSALLAYAGATHNDKGLQAMGWPPYKDFAAGRHNDGYSDFTFDRIPEANGRKAWSIGLPDGNLP